ncbi:unnamed protein product [Rotaria sp. Silwood1]|nr:unnamed protein product [Rotaria sp. Silwood1]CAF5012263.1 unnamed protein product [Rotaria sp. Silwood1]
MCDRDSSDGIFFQVQGLGEATVGFPNDADSRVLNLANTELTDSPDSVHIFWSYPAGVMTLIIETPYTKQYQPYTISLDTEHMRSSIEHIYRLLDGQKIEIPINNAKSIQKSDSNYQVILEFHGPPQMKTYGVNINYDISSN